MEADFKYFSRRAQEEREAAMKAAHPIARQSHVELAERYNELATALETHHHALHGNAIQAL